VYQQPAYQQPPQQFQQPQATFNATAQPAGFVGFNNLPGGAGTLEEVFEIWTWGQLALHAKPAAFLNVEGYYDPLRTFLDHAVGEGFLRESHRDMLIFGEDPQALIEGLAAYQPPAEEKWLERFQL
jgi:predicted Rossmann-fold nucleotide-binding protein